MDLKEVKSMTSYYYGMVLVGVGFIIAWTSQVYKNTGVVLFLMGFLLLATIEREKKEYT